MMESGTISAPRSKTMTANNASNETNRRLQRLEEGQAGTNRRLDKLEAGQEDLRAGQEELRAGQEELRAGQEELRGRMDRVEHAVQALRDDIGPLKASHTRDSALRVSYRICEDLGLDEVSILDRNDLRAMIRQADTSGIPRNHRYSFIEADAIIEAVDDSGETHYIAMEASFTADERDTNRAVRNAEYLTRFTGQPAHAVIAAHRIDNRIEALIASGKVSLCRLNENDLEID